jgi:hypothetical protein
VKLFKRFLAWCRGDTYAAPGSEAARIASIPSPSLPHAGCRTCYKCGFVHEYVLPVHRCTGCRTWGQDFYELPPLRPRIKP